MSLWELAIVAIVALLVLGPEILIQFAYHTGRISKRIRRYLDILKRDVEHQLAARAGVVQRATPRLLRGLPLSRQDPPRVSGYPRAHRSHERVLA